MMYTIQRFFQRVVRTCGTIARRAWQSSIAWWKRGDTRYGIWWRIASALVALVILVSSSIPLINIVTYNLWYKLDDETQKLVGTTDQSLVDKLSYNQATKSYEFNKSALKGASANPYAAMQAQVGSGSESLYALDVHEDGKKGVTYHDVNSGLDFSLVPTFHSGSGKVIDGHLVYPMSGGSKLIYTLKNNGLKEDIVVPKVTSNEMSFEYSLELPKTLEARVIPDGSGAVGVYSASPTLFADTSYNTEKDREAVEKARESSEKSYLVFGLPAPVIKDTTGKTVGNARFTLSGSTLTLVASDLADIKTPIAIDPSVVVTSATDFQTNGNNDGNISFATSGQVSRSLIGGGTRPWSATTSLPVGNTAPATATYNGYMYVMGGHGFTSSVYYSQINTTTGAVDSWTQTSTMNTPRMYAGGAAYNGYIYVWGGYDTSSGTATASVEYAPINADGTLGAWQDTTSMSTAVCRAATVMYKGYLYSFGGSTTPNASCTAAATGGTNVVQYAALKADGTVDSWQTTTSLAYGSSNQVIGAMAGGYNGYMYVMGGHNNGGGTAYSNAQYATINTDGSLSSWTATTALPAAIHGAGFTIHNGYLYMLSDQNAATTSRYAPIYTGGEIGNWFYVVNKPLTSGRWGGNAVAYENHLYYIGGSGSSSVVDHAELLTGMRIDGESIVTSPFTSTRERGASVSYNGCLFELGGYGSNSNIYVEYAQSAPVTATGNITAAWPNKSFSTARADLAAVAYDGYLYVIGGFNSTTYYNLVQYVPINADCTLGTWASTTAFDTAGNARGGISAFVYNGYIYVAGGRNAAGNFSTVRYAPLNSNGTVGTWNNTTALPSAMNRHKTVVWGDKVYLLGGTTIALPNPNNGATTGSRPTGAGSSSTYYATINNDGTLSNWTATSPLPYAPYEFGAVALGGYMFTLGGFTSTGLDRTWSSAPINSDGSLGSWTTLYDRGASFPIASVNLVTANGYLYTMGGRTDTGLTGTNRPFALNRAHLIDGGGGATTTWSASSSIVTGRNSAGSAAYNGHMYVVGGSTDGTNGRTDIEYSPINANGSLGSFSTDSHSLSSGRMFPGVTAYRGHLYIVGGKTGSGYYGNVQYTDIWTNGALGSNFTTSSSFTTGTGSDTGRAGVCTVAYNDHLYAIGGWDGTTYHNTARYTNITPETGALNTWSDAGNNFTNGRYGSSCFAANGYMYILGGRNGSTNYNDVQMAPINSNGTLGAWSYTARFTGARSHFITGFNNGFVYIHGGCTTNACTAGYSDVQYAQVGLDGKLSNWQRRPTTDTADTPYLTTGTVYNSYIYQLGGSANSAVTRYAPMQVTPRTATYSKFIDLGALSKISNITYNGKLTNSSMPGLSPVTFRSANANNEFFPSTLSASVDPGTVPCDTTNPAYTRYLRIDVSIDNVISSAFADTSDLQSYLTDLTINYSPVHPSPETRLRGGQTLQEGTLSALDTCYP